MRQQLVKSVASTELSRRVWSWWSHRQTEVYLLSYPKCGRTWLRLLVGKALIEELGLDEASPMRLKDLHRHSRLVPRMRVTHDDNPHLKRVEELEPDKRRYAGKSVIFMVRNPRDVVVSYYFHATRRSGLFSGSIAEFLRHPVGSLDTILDYYNIWAENRGAPGRFCLVRYEDLHRSTAGELERVLACLGRAPKPAVLERAIEFARFDNMRALESKDVFGSAAMRAGNSADPESFKTRKGVVGGYREYFSPEDLAYVEERIRTRLSPFYSDYT